MGLLRKILAKIFLMMLFIAAGCSDAVIVKNALLEKPVYPMFGKIPERDFFYNFDLGDSLTFLWEGKNHGSFAHTSVTLYHNSVFAPDLSGRLKVYDRETGDKISEGKQKGEIAVAPVIHQQKVFYVLNDLESTEVILYVDNFFSGKNLREIKLNGKCTNELLKDDEAIYLLEDNGTLYSFNFFGIKNWEIKTGTLTLSSPAMKGNIIVFGNSKGELIGIDKEEQKIIYRKKLSGGIESGAAISGSAIFIGDSEGVLYKIDLKDGEVIWKFPTGAKIKTVPVQNDKNIFIGNLSGEMFSMNKESGELNWRSDTGGILNSTPLLFNDYLVQPDMAKKIYFIDVESGVTKNEIQFDLKVKMSPVFFDGTIFFGTDYGKLFAYKPAEPL